MRVYEKRRPQCCPVSCEFCAGWHGSGPKTVKNELRTASRGLPTRDVCVPSSPLFPPRPLPLQAGIFCVSAVLSPTGTRTRESNSPRMRHHALLASKLLAVTLLALMAPLATATASFQIYNGPGTCIGLVDVRTGGGRVL